MLSTTVFTFLFLSSVLAQGPSIPDPLPDVTPPGVVNLLIQNIDSQGEDLVASIIHADSHAATYSIGCNPAATACGFDTWQTPIIMTQGVDFSEWSYQEGSVDGDEYFSFSEVCAFSGTKAKTAICTNEFDNGGPTAEIPMSEVTTMTYDGGLLTVDGQGYLAYGQSLFGPPPFYPITVTAGLEKLSAMTAATASGSASTTGSSHSSILNPIITSMGSSPTTLSSQSTNPAPTSSIVGSGSGKLTLGSLFGMSSIFGLGFTSGSTFSTSALIAFYLFVSASAQELGPIAKGMQDPSTRKLILATLTVDPLAAATWTPRPNLYSTVARPLLAQIPARSASSSVVQFPIGDSFAQEYEFKVGDIMGSVIAVEATATTYELTCPTGRLIRRGPDFPLIEDSCAPLTITQGPSTMVFSSVGLAEGVFTEVYTQSCNFANSATMTCTAHHTQSISIVRKLTNGPTTTLDETSSSSTTWTYSPEETEVPWVGVVITAGLEKVVETTSSKTSQDTTTSLNIGLSTSLPVLSTTSSSSGSVQTESSTQPPVASQTPGSGAGKIGFGGWLGGLMMVLTGCAVL